MVARARSIWMGVVLSLLFPAVSWAQLHPLSEGKTLVVNGQVFRGTLYIGVLRTEDGFLMSSLEGISPVYVIVEDLMPSGNIPGGNDVSKTARETPTFVYDKRKSAKTSADYSLLFGKRGTSVTSDVRAVRIDEHHWELTGKLVFGCVARRGEDGVNRYGGNWVFNENGVVFPEETDASAIPPASLRGKGGFERIVAKYSEVLQRDPNDVKARWIRADAYCQVGKRKEAITDYDWVARLEPNWLETYLRRGECYGMIDEFEKAIEDFSRYIEQEPREQIGYLRRGQTYQWMRDFSHALRDYEQAGEPLVVSVIATSAPLMIGRRVVATVSKDENLFVTKVNGKWLWAKRAPFDAVGPEAPPAEEAGWIDQKHVQ